MSDSNFNQTTALIAAAAVANNDTAVAEIYKGHERLSPNSMYSGAEPGLAFNAIAMSIFFVFTAWQFILLINYKNRFFGVCMVLYLVGQAIGYLGRMLSASDITGLSLNNEDYFLMQFISLTISPNLFNAAIYSQYGKILFTYATTRDNLVKLNVFGKRVQPILLGTLFIASDITCLFIQGVSGAIEGTAVDNNDESGLKLGNNIFIAGLSIQTASMSLFLVVYIKLLYNIYIRQRIEFLNKEKDISNSKQIPYNNTFFAPWKWPAISKSVKFEDIDPIMQNIDTSKFSSFQKRLFHTYPFALAVAFGLAVIRCIYRLIELADNGFEGYLMTHENFLISLDFVPLSISALIMCFYSEGIVYGMKGLYEAFLVKKCSYRGLTSWKQLHNEFRYMLHLDVDDEKLDREFNDQIKNQVEEKDIDGADVELSSKDYYTKSIFFKNSMNHQTDYSCWKSEDTNDNNDQPTQESFADENQTYESSLKTFTKSDS